MAEIEKLDGKSLDVVEQNIEQLKELFPSVFSEGKIQFNKLEELLGNYVVEDEDHYNFTWHGKRKAGRLAQTPSTGTLRPCKEESPDWDTTENIFIEGDNLEVLKLLQKSYHRQVKMIYIDPPYNTGNDFVYEDDFKDGVKHYLEMTGQLDGEGKKFGTNSSSAGRIHTNWLNMIYPRLKLARNLLREDGIIAIHIDEHEVANLASLMDNIFGVENNLGPIIWDKKNPKGDATKIATQHEYLVLYARDAVKFKNAMSIKRPKANAEKMLATAERIFKKLGSISLPDDLTEASKKYNLEINLDDFKTEYTLADVNAEYKTWLAKQTVSGGEAAYKHIDENGDVFRTVSMAWPNKKLAPEEYFIPLKHPQTGKECPVPDRGWRNPPGTMKQLLDANMIVFGQDETKQPERKYLLKENMTENVPSVLPFGGSDDALLKELDIPFDNPKPVRFVQQILQHFLSRNEIVMDFFAGSGTVAHACLKSNVELGSENSFVCVQFPEVVNSNNKEQKAAYDFCKKYSLPTNIAELSKERIRRAAKKIKDENPEYSGDLGFKVFKLDSSNIKRWDADFDTLKQDLVDAADYLVKDRTDEDVLYELCLKLGLDLSVKIDEESVAGEKLFVLGRGYLVVCLSDNVTMDVVNGIGGLKDKLAPEDGMRVVFKDDGFKDDVIKTNALQTLKRFGITDIKSL